MGIWYRHEADVVILNLYIQPSAKHTEISGFHGDALKIRLASQPVDGRANEALLKYVAQLFGVPVRQVELKRGDKSRHKILIVKGSKINPESLNRAG